MTAEEEAVVLDKVEKGEEHHPPQQQQQKEDVPDPPGIVKQKSRAELRQDPFAAREGKTLLWRNVNMTLAGKKGERKLLSDVWGEVPEKEITAIMGPSGAGKTSLLNILAGRQTSRGKIKIEADVRLNNYQVDPTNVEVRKQIAFVTQEDSLLITATPRESIKFSAKLRLPRETTDDDIDHLADRMLEELGLQSCADTIVGGVLIKGISGGEKKRTSVGVELVVKPAMVFLDEPTSGLDSFSAVQLVQVLKKVANAGASVLFTIHQPASEVFNSFDQVILMNKGRVMCQGAVNKIPDFFAEHGHPIPEHYNPADWIMYVAQSVSEAQLDDEGFFPADKRDIPAAFKAGEEEGKDALGLTITRHTDNDFDGRHVSFGTETRLLFHREIINMKRNKKTTMARFVFTSFMSLLVGVIFFDVGNTSNSDMISFQSHFGALIMVLMLSMFGTAMPSLLAFPEERPVFLREYSTNHYSVGAYFMSRLCVEAFITFCQILLELLITYWLIGIQMNFGYLMGIVFVLAMASTAVAVMLGCAVEDPKLATQFLPILFVPQLLFAGFFVSTSLIPNWLVWAQYLCSLTYAVRLALWEEFGQCATEGTVAEGRNNCKRLLDNNNVEEDNVWWWWLVLVCLFVVFRVCALLILRKKATKFF